MSKEGSILSSYGTDILAKRFGVDKYDEKYGMWATIILGLVEQSSRVFGPVDVLTEDSTLWEQLLQPSVLMTKESFWQYNKLFHSNQKPIDSDG